MIRKVFRTGNSVVVSLPREAIEILGMHEGTEIEIRVDRENRQVIVKRVELSSGIPGVDEDFARQVAEFIEEYRPALEALAK